MYYNANYNSNIKELYLVIRLSGELPKPAFLVSGVKFRQVCKILNFSYIL
jgi:hypothetical protein